MNRNHSGKGSRQRRTVVRGMISVALHMPDMLLEQAGDQAAPRSYHIRDGTILSAATNTSDRWIRPQVRCRRAPRGALITSPHKDRLIEATTKSREVRLFGQETGQGLGGLAYPMCGFQAFCFLITRKPQPV